MNGHSFTELTRRAKSRQEEMGPSMDILRAEGVDYKAILQGISLTVPSGKIFGVSGPSGSGKSTLLKLLCRLEDVTAGTVYFKAQPIQNFDPKIVRRKVTMVFQTPVLLGPRVIDDLALGKRFEPKSPSSNAQEELSWGKILLQKVYLSPGLLMENPKRLSVGESQRVALARALAIQPEVLLLDEPTASLDMESKQFIEQTLSAEAKNGLTILLVSHERRQMEEVAMHGVELNRGRIQQSW